MSFTWAVVAALFDLRTDELHSAPDGLSVGVLRPMLGPFRQRLPTVGRVLGAPEAFLDPALMDRLVESPVGHELATDTYFHALPTTAAGLQADVQACRRAMTRRPLSTIVYPRETASTSWGALPGAGVTQEPAGPAGSGLLPPGSFSGGRSGEALAGPGARAPCGSGRGQGAGRRRGSPAAACSRFATVRVAASRYQRCVDGFLNTPRRRRTTRGHLPPLDSPVEPWRSPAATGSGCLPRSSTEPPR